MGICRSNAFSDCCKLNTSIAISTKALFLWRKQLKGLMESFHPSSTEYKTVSVSQNPSVASTHTQMCPRAYSYRGDYIKQLYGEWPCGFMGLIVALRACTLDARTDVVPCVF